MPLTPDYDGPLVCYADGVFDSRFNRYLTVREGRLSIFIFLSGTVLLKLFDLLSYLAFILILMVLLFARPS